MTTRAAKVISIEPLETKDAKWLNLVKIIYEDVNGKVRDWEGMKRITRPRNSIVDAVQMIAILDKPGDPEVLLEKQFRPPAGKRVVEFPAGLVDEGETPEQAAIRELREETGYVGEVIPDRGQTRPILWSSPASSSSCSFLINFRIDMSRPENQTPKPQLEEGEFIECFSLPLKDLYLELRNLEEQGFAIDGKVCSFAEGLEVSRIWMPALN